MLGGYTCTDESILFWTDIPQSRSRLLPIQFFLHGRVMIGFRRLRMLQKWKLTKTEDSRYLLKLPIDSDFRFQRIFLQI